MATEFRAFANAIEYGDLVGRLLDFAVVALVVFAILTALVREARPAPTRSCPECLEAVPLAALRPRLRVAPAAGAGARGALQRTAARGEGC